MGMGWIGKVSMYLISSSCDVPATWLPSLRGACSGPLLQFGFRVPIRRDVAYRTEARLNRSQLGNMVNDRDKASKAINKKNAPLCCGIFRV